MPELKPNSHKFKETEEKKTERKLAPVTSQKVKVQKKTAGKKVLESFITTDAETLGDYIFNDVIVPLIKRGIVETVNMILYNNPRSIDSKGNSASKISYGGYVNSAFKAAPQQALPLKKKSQTFDFENIIFETRRDAENVLNAMYEAIKAYGDVSVLDFYDLADINTDNFTAHKYGWTDLSSADILRGHNGYYIKFPDVRPINN